MKYFAYGSNMSTQRLLKRCPSAVVEEAAKISRYSLRFHKPGVDGTAKADCYWTGSTKDIVCGVIFSISAADVAALDATEGEGVHYARKTCRVVTASGRRRTVQVYTALLISTERMYPSSQYLSHLVIGTEEHELPQHYSYRIYSHRTQHTPAQQAMLDDFVRRRQLAVQ